jgi:hypothetical protein
MCPHCGEEAEVGAKFCARCGKSLRMPPQRDTTPVEPVPLADEEPETLLWRIGIWFFEIFPGVARPAVISMSLLALVVGGIVAGLGAMMLGFGAIFFAILAGAVALICYWTALSWLMYGYVCLLPEAMSEFDGRHWLVLMLATFGPLGLVFALTRPEQRPAAPQPPAVEQPAHEGEGEEEDPFEMLDRLTKEQLGAQP